MFLEDGTLDIVENLEEIYTNYKGVDVENEVCRFFDANGQYLEPHFKNPNRYLNILWMYLWCRSGEYELTPNPDANTDSLGLSLYETIKLYPNKWFKDLNDVKQYFEKKGISLELIPEGP
ncbi:MAG: hypothetical protein JW891_02955 [Candidatus Lokiarchaeota archaeon]|nr:hypothetical protein [Candidatus Lokiarchaeota archaeon]